MKRPFRFGVQSMDFGEVDVVRSTARACSELGYDEFFTADHVGAPDPFAPLLVAAHEAADLRVGPLVLNNSFHNPVLVARSAATIDQMIGGRFVLGLGTGYNQSEHDGIGVPLPAPGARVSQLDESVRAVRDLLDTGAACIDGDHISIDVADLGIRPVQASVPFLIGGHGRRVVSIAGRHADIFQFTGLTHAADGSVSPGGFRLDDLRQRSEWLGDAAGDRADQIERSALVQRSAVGVDAASAAQEAMGKWGLRENEMADCPFGLFGSVEQIVDKLERLRDSLGISHYVVRDTEGFAPVVAALRGR